MQESPGRSDFGSRDEPVQDSAAIQSYYEKWWENPQDLRNVVFERLNQEMARLLSGVRGRRALDLGAGKGRIVSILEQRDFHVTAVEFNPGFVRGLQAAFPDAEVIQDDLRTWRPSGHFDIATCIEVAQVLPHGELAALLTRLRPHVDRLLLNISNSRSFHGLWVRMRGFQAPFIVPYTPTDLRGILRDAGFRIVSETGVGFVTPITILRDFRGAILSPWLAARLRALDAPFPDWCHLLLVEALPCALGGKR